MHVTLFNRTRAVDKTKPRRPRGPRRPEDIPRDEDLLGVLDPGFEDVGYAVRDFQVADGVVGHFSTMANPPPNYFAMPTLERRASID
jgi:hypothetical protein